MTCQDAVLTNCSCQPPNKNPYLQCQIVGLGEKCVEIDQCGQDDSYCQGKSAMADCTTCSSGLQRMWWTCVAGNCSGPHTDCGLNEYPECAANPSVPCGSLACNFDTDCDWCWPECVCYEGICSLCTPIVIDVSGNGYDLTDAANGVYFDFKGNGSLVHTAWTARDSDDAWLALDRNGNGTIDNAKELFGSFTPQPTPPLGQKKNGFLALAEFDSLAHGGNRDGQIDGRDSIFSLLRLWQDVNHNGISESAELHSLSDAALAVIDLDYKESRKTDQHGNKFKYRAKVKDVRGAQLGRWAWDVILTRLP